MKAIVRGASGSSELRGVDVPVPTEYEVLVRVHASSLNGHGDSLVRRLRPTALLAVGSDTRIRSGETTLRYAHKLRSSHLKDANVMLLSARPANPRVELFRARLNYQTLFDSAQRRDHILNRNPVGRAQPSYIDHEREGQRRSYSVVSFVAGMNEPGHALLVVSTTSADTEAAIDLVVNEQRFGQFPRSIKKGHQIPSSEPLLHKGNVAGNARQTELIGFRVHPR